ncbi:sirohydrochlorin chelatase [Streptomyces sp. NPDC014733]|uniref:sirohydrochlorin chelatase n=1 Tax=Streptomyces sp. NPDC014733 TaxID=3364885 RepID=UPI0036FE8E91
MTASRSRTPLPPPGAAPYGPGGPGADGGWQGRGGPALVAVAHGSRDPRALPAVRALLARVRALRPGLPVRLGHLGLDRPPLADTLAGLRGGAVLVPLLFGHGHHVTHDLPAALAAAPHLDGRIAAPLGPHPLLAEALHGRLTEAGFIRYAAPGRLAHTAVVLAAAGSRAPRSAAGTEAVAALLSARLGGLPVVPGYASAATPTVTAAVRALADRGHRRIAVAGCFTAPGRFAARCAADAPDTAAAPLGDHPALARLLLHRYDEARAAGGGCPVAAGPSATGRDAAGGDGSARRSAGAATVAV